MGASIAAPPRFLPPGAASRVRAASPQPLPWRRRSSSGTLTGERRKKIKCMTGGVHHWATWVFPKVTATQPNRLLALSKAAFAKATAQPKGGLHPLKREMFKDLAPLMWQSFGTIIILLQEILSVYPALSPPTLTACASSRVCSAVALLQSVASHPETRTSFLKAEIPIYLYPLLNTVSNARSFEYLRLTSLGVIGALVKADDTEVINYLLRSEIIPLCLRIMETGEELSKTVATFIVERIVLDEAGLQYICSTVERFFALASVLESMLIPLAEQPSTRLLKHIICCYRRLADHPRAHMALQIRLPEALKNGTFDHCLEVDPVAKNYLRQLLDCVAAPWAGAPESGPNSAAGGTPHAGPGSSQAGPSFVRR